MYAIKLVEKTGHGFRGVKGYVDGIVRGKKREKLKPLNKTSQINEKCF